ncbi:MAG: hypothetical protein ACOYVD_12265 [Bacillota bacterium]
METQEDIEYNRKRAADNIIANYCISKGVTGEKEILENPENLKGLIKELLEGTRLSHWQIAGILGIGNNIVHRVSIEE